MSARDAILERLRAGRDHGDRQDGEGSGGAPLLEMSSEQKVALFSEKMSSTRTEVHEVSSNDWSKRLLGLAQEKNARNLLYSAAVDSGVDIENTWSAGADDSSVPELNRVDEINSNWKYEVFNHIDAAVTTCRGGIAATGSLVLWPDHHEPRLMSLAPPVHFALLDAEKLYSDFARMLAAEHWAQGGMPTNALLISGPSKTADIESTLAYGVHGPKQLVVLLLR